MYRRFCRDRNNDQSDSKAFKLFIEVGDGCQRILGILRRIARKKVFDFGWQKSPSLRAFDRRGLRGFQVFLKDSIDLLSRARCQGGEKEEEAFFHRMSFAKFGSSRSSSPRLISAVLPLCVRPTRQQERNSDFLTAFHLTTISDEPAKGAIS